jgi:hypothetical protein
MNNISSVLDLLRQQANRDGLASASTAELERYATALCFSQAFSHFGAQEYPQLCETVRVHLLRAHIGNLQSHVVELHNHITDLNKKNALTQKLVIVLTVVSVIGSAIQIWYADKADKRIQDQALAVAAQPQPAQLPTSTPTPAKPPSNHSVLSPVTVAPSKTKTP